MFAVITRWRHDNEKIYSLQFMMILTPNNHDHVDHNHVIFIYYYMYISYTALYTWFLLHAFEKQKHINPP